MDIENLLEIREFNNAGIFPTERMGYDESVELSINSLKAYGANTPVWMVSYSGGKDSSATLAFVVDAIVSGQVKAPERLSVMYADTGMELPPLYLTAMKTLEQLRALGIDTHHVRPPLDKRFFVYMLGRGVPPPTRNRRWCTERLKAEPIKAAQKSITSEYGKVLNLTGVRKGESAIRDGRIALSCSKNDGECGQGWFQKIENSLAPLLHWRVCHIWRYIYRQTVLPNLRDVADIYLYDEFQEIRTGCVECFIVDEDWAFRGLLRKPQWQYLRPLTGLRTLYNELLLPAKRLRKVGEAAWIKKYGALGPLTMEAREYALEKIKAMQMAANYTLIDDEQEARIRELMAANTWPKGWTGQEPVGIEPYEPHYKGGLVQLLLPFAN